MAHASVGYVLLPSFSTGEPPRKRSRVEDSSGAADTATVATWSVGAITEGLRRYVQPYVSQLQGCSSVNAGDLIDVRIAPSDASGGRDGQYCTFSLLRGAVGANGESALTHRSAVTPTDELLFTVPLPRRLFICDSALLLPVFHQRLPLSSPATAATTTSSTSLGEVLEGAVLLVGAGGIGCEVLKVLVLSGFRVIHIVDLDTIDATNLNRQFLFTAEDIGQSKAVTARAAVLKWFHRRADADEQREELSLSSSSPPTIVAHHDNIKSAQFDGASYRQFAVVINALDNVSARQHVNRMCMAMSVPLIESGTMGYNGQVQPILRGVSECYDCTAKPPDQKSYAVCTIHARPTTMVHCVYYGKELLETLFAEPLAEAHSSDAVPDGAEEGVDSRHRSTGPGGELSFLRGMVSESAAQARLGDGGALPSLATRLIRCLFVDKINELLGMKTSWPTQPPQTLGSEVIDQVSAAVQDMSTARVMRCVMEKEAPPSLVESGRMFAYAVSELLRRGTLHEGFRKEDDMAVQFVAATANLRAHAFHIEMQSVEELRSIAGAIVPAISTTNAIIAACAVEQCVDLLSHRSGSPARTPLSMAYARKVPQMRRRRLGYQAEEWLSAYAGRSASRHPLSTAVVKDHYFVHGAVVSPPRRGCRVCQHTTPTVTVTVDATQTTLGSLVREVMVDRLGFEAPSVSSGAAGHVLYEEEDYEDLAPRLLMSLWPSGSSVLAGPLSLLVDSLNKDVEWIVEVVHRAAADGQHGTTVDSVAEALEVETHALRTRELEQEQASSEQQADEMELVRNTEGAGEDNVLFIISDDDVDEDLMIVE